MSTPPKAPDSAAPMKNYAVAGIEPALSEVLDDPIVHLLMARDGVTRGSLELLIEWVRQNRLAVQPVSSQRQSGAPDDRVGGGIVGVALKRDVRPTAASPSIPCHRCEVRNRIFCAGVEPEELHRLDAIATEVNLKPRQNVFFEGDPAGFVFNVTRGMVRASKALPDGRRQITGFFYPGDFLGVALHSAYVYTVEAVTSVTFCRFPRSKLRTLFDEFPKLEIHLLSATASELAMAQDRMLLLGRKSAREKVASFLLMLAQRAERCGENGRLLNLPMNRLDIADYLGLSMETVCRTLSTFRKERLIDYEMSKSVVLWQRDQLESMAEST